MRKGKIGLTYTFYASLAFVLMLFGVIFENIFSPMTMLLLLTGFVVVVEKDEWASRQCLQAFLLCFGYIIMDNFAPSFGTSVLDDILQYLNPAQWVSAIIWFVLWVIMMIFTIMGLVRVRKGQEANIPIVSKIAYKAFGYVQQSAPPVYTAQQGQPYPPQAPPPYQPQAPMGGQPPMNNMQSQPPQQPPMGQQPGMPLQNQPGQQPPMPPMPPQE